MFKNDDDDNNNNNQSDTNSDLNGLENWLNKLLIQRTQQKNIKSNLKNKIFMTP